MKLSEKIAHVLCAVGALLCIGTTVWLFFDPLLQTQLTGWLTQAVCLLLDDVITDPASFPAFVTIWAAFAGLSAGAGAAVWYLFHRTKRSPLAAGATALLLLVCSFFAVTTVYTLWEIALSVAAGGFGFVLGMLLYNTLKKKLPKIFNRETVNYIVFGVMTTVVSFISQMLFHAMSWNTAFSTVGSWVCAVTFAYITNKLFVFESHTDTLKAFLRELWLFVAARLASLVIEVGLMLLLVDLLGLPTAGSKMAGQIIILITNYVLSKLIVFRKKDTPPTA